MQEVNYLLCPFAQSLVPIGQLVHVGDIVRSEKSMFKFKHFGVHIVIYSTSQGISLG